jgi:hypothetical protein
MMKATFLGGLFHPWSTTVDPTGILVQGETYDVASIDVRSWHTRIYLVRYEGLAFNSSMFKLDAAAQFEMDRQIAQKGPL